MRSRGERHAEPLDSIEVAPSWGRRVAGIEGLRALAATTVLVGHVHDLSPITTDFGPATTLMPLLAQGLTLFFALSGFLLFRPFAAAIVGARTRPNLAKYAVNRVLRIYPAYIAITLLVALVLGTANVAPLQPGAVERGDRVGYLHDVGLLALDLTMLQNLVPAGMQTGLGVAWTLTVELIFYLALPLLALLSGVLLKRSIPPFVAALIPAALLLVTGATSKAVGMHMFAGLKGEDAVVHLWGASWSAVFARSFLMHADLFAFGMVGAVVVELFILRRVANSVVQTTRWCGVALALLSCLVAILPIGFFRDTAFAIAAGAVIFFVAAPAGPQGAGVPARVLDFAPLRFLGIISYSTYLWHVSVIWLVLRYGFWVPGPSVGAFVLNVVIVLALTTTVSTATYFLIERPSLKLKGPLDKRIMSASARRAVVPATESA